jgi:catechol 2,3-dioxygenase-like lactoylglutathione lyase family enzyme
MAGVKGKTKKKPPAKAPKPSLRARPAAKPKTAARPRPAAKPKPAARARAAVKPVAAAPAVAARPAPPTQTPPAPYAPSHQPRLTPRPLMRGDFVLEKLHQVALTATNLDAAVVFYRDILGLKFIARFDPPGLAFFALSGGARLLLSATASQATLYFLVDDVDGAVNELKKRGVSFLHPPAKVHRDEAGDFGKKGSEEWMAFFKDPSGNLVGLVERR